MPAPRSCDVAIVGSGFAGSILARALAARGLDVVLLERGTHPRFAIGESSTPLAALRLERLAHHYGLADLADLAAWGRWRERLPDLHCGRKRGFTFYRHRAATEFDPGPQNERRLLVAASPTDRVADAHWLRADVDAHLVARAAREGVDYRDEVELTTARPVAGGIELEGAHRGTGLVVRAAFAVDATGPAGFLAGALGVAPGTKLRTVAGLVYGHFDAVEPLAAVAGPFPGEAPYPEEWAAVHHLVDEGWLYELRFDSGLVSAGLLVEGGLPPNLDAEAAWQAALARYPSLARQFRSARPVRAVASVPRLQYRRGAAAGPRWAALPHAFAFVDPLFSTGIAWSLAGVERLAEVLAAEGAGRPALADGGGLARYAQLLAAEAEQIDRLVAGAYRARCRFDLFCAQAMLYFALVSFAETRLRLLAPPEPAWEGFLAAGEPHWEAILEASEGRLAALTAGGRVPSDEEALAFTRWVVAAIAPRNVAGLADPARRNLYPVDLDLLIERAPLLGLEPEEVRRAVPRLRGGA